MATWRHGRIYLGGRWHEPSAGPLKLPAGDNSAYLARWAAALAHEQVRCRKTKRGIKISRRGIQGMTALRRQKRPFWGGPPNPSPRSMAIRFVGPDRYRLQYKIVEDRSFSPEIVGRRSRGATRTSDPNNPVLQQLVTDGDRQNGLSVLLVQISNLRRACNRPVSIDLRA